MVSKLNINAFRRRTPRGRRVPVIQQLSAVECGAACLAMILSHHGRQTSVAECREKCSPGRDGLTALTIANAARAYGLRVKAYSLEPSSLSYLSFPVIAHWNFNHFLIVEHWAPGRVEVVDPARGRLTLTAAEFDEGFTGVVLALEPGAHFERRDDRRGASWLGYLRSILTLPGAKISIGQVLAASLALQVTGLALPLFTKVIIDRVLPLQLSGVMTTLGLGLLLVVAAQAIISLLRSSLLIYLRGRLDSHLMFNFFEHLLSLPFGFFQKRTSGDLLMRLSSNSFIREVLTNNTLSILLDGSFVLIYLLILLSVSPSFGLLAAGLGSLQIVLVLTTRDRIAQLMQRELAAKAAEQGYLVEAVSNISLLKATGVEPRALDRWSDLYYAQLNISLERGERTVVIETLMGALRTLSPLVLLWLGTAQVLGGGLSLGTMLALNALAASFLAPISMLVTNGQQLLLVGAHLERISDVLDAEPEQSATDGKVSFPLSGRVEVRNLSFQYEPQGPLVLRDVSFSAEPGQKIAVVGQTGSGKSTLAMLLLGLYQPTHGEILYDGVSLRQFNYRDLRARTGVVLQEPLLFSGSILQNITFGNPSLPLERVVEAARAAGIHDDIMRMPMGYETFVAEGGSTLSGGQRQRLALARALANEPSVLILDEATSHLDVEKEAEVEAHLTRLACTRVVIAHRLSTVRNASQILVLHEGEVVERGTHDELLAKRGRYAALVQAGPEPARRGGASPGGGGRAEDVAAVELIN